MSLNTLYLIDLTVYSNFQQLSELIVFSTWLALPLERPTVELNTTSASRHLGFSSAVVRGLVKENADIPADGISGTLAGSSQLESPIHEVLLGRKA